MKANFELFPYAFESKIYKPGCVFPYTVYTIGEADEAHPYALAVIQDGAHPEIADVTETLYRAGKAPACLIIGVHSGWMKLKDDDWFLMRSENYDAFDPAYGDFLIEELIPHVIAEGGYPVSSDPDRHLIGGCSSGGGCSFIAAWFHPEYFRRVFLSSPAFLSIGKADEMLSVIRKGETKPFRIALEFTEHEPDAYFGDLKQLVILAEKAFLHAGYTFQCRYEPRLEHGWSFHVKSVLFDALSYLWEDYETQPAAPEHQPPRTEDIYDPADGWQPCTAAPEPRREATASGVYRAEAGRILLENKVVADESEFSDLRDVALAVHQKRLYVADAGRGCLYEYVVNGDGTLGARYRHGFIHIKPDFERPGAYSLCVDDVNRIYAATELGIQCVTTNGLVEAILTPPDYRSPTVRLSIASDEAGHWLYAETADGRLFRRRIKHASRQSVTEIPEDYSHFVY